MSRALPSAKHSSAQCKIFCLQTVRILTDVAGLTSGVDSDFSEVPRLKKVKDFSIQSEELDNRLLTGGQ